MAAPNKGSLIVSQPTPDDLRAAAEQLRIRAGTLDFIWGEAYWPENKARLAAEAAALRRVATLISTMAEAGNTLDLHRAAFAAGFAMADAPR